MSYQCMTDVVFEFHASSLLLMISGTEPNQCTCNVKNNIKTIGLYNTQVVNAY